MSLPAISGIVSNLNVRIKRSRESLRSLTQPKDKENQSDAGSVKSNAGSIGSLLGSIANNNPNASVSSQKSIRRRLSLFPSSHKRGYSSASTGHYPYTVYEQNMSPIILKDSEATRKMIEIIHEMPGGKRTIARLARTCRAFKELSLNVLWKDLDSILPLVGLFPAYIMKRPRRPALGLNKMPVDADWKDLLEYGDRVRAITYEESAHSVPTNIFPVFEDRRPRAWIMPNLTSIVWKCETPAGLDRVRTFLNPQLKSLTLEVGTRFSNLSEFLVLLRSCTRLTEFSITSPSPLPDNFSEIMKTQDKLEKLSLLAEGSLSSKIGKWVDELSSLRTLELDLVGRQMSAVESFFDEIIPHSGATTPSSVGSRDSGVFSADELDFTEIRKSAVRITGDATKRACTQLRNLKLTGDAGILAMFLKHLSGHIHFLELVIEDPPEETDWQDLCAVISEQFCTSLRKLTIGATGSSKAVDLARSARMSSLPLKRLPLQNLTALPKLVELEIDLPMSVIFNDEDLKHIAKICPDIQVLKLCPSARYPNSFGPPLTLEGIAPLTEVCKRLHTLAIVVNATAGSDEVLSTRTVSSKSLFCLHVGHSHLKDPLHAAILLSHLAPFLDNLKWSQERTRSGSLDSNTGGWQRVCEFLPHLQNTRLMEKRMAADTVVIIPRQMSEKGVNATVITSNSGVQAVVETIDFSVQVSPVLVDQGIAAAVETMEESVDATPKISHVDISAVPSVKEQSVGAHPSTDRWAAACFSSLVSKHETSASSESNSSNNQFPELSSLPSIQDVVLYPFRVVRAYTQYIITPVRFLLSRSNSISESGDEKDVEKVAVSSEVAAELSRDDRGMNSSASSCEIIV